MAQKAFSFLQGGLKDYLSAVSAKEHVPGGGSVAACTAALSSSVLGMVISYTVGKKKYSEHSEYLAKMKRDNDEMLKILSSYIEEDSRLYDNIVSSSKTDPVRVEEYTKQSASLHLDICRRMLVVIEFAEFLAENGNKNLISDTGIAAELAVSAFKSSKLNIFINLKFLQDKPFVKDSVEEIKKLEEMVFKQGESVFNEALNQLL